jgi:hypothetical protein
MALDLIGPAIIRRRPEFSHPKATTMPAATPSPSVATLDRVTDNVRPMVEAALESGSGVLRTAPCWVPRSFLHPGRRLKLHPDDLYAYGVNRGGIDERWLSSTTEAANEGRTPDEGLSSIVFEGKRCLLRDAIAELGGDLVGDDIWTRYKRWPVYSKFFDNMGPIPLHMHQSNAQAALIGLEGKPEAYYFPPQMNNVGNNFPYTFFGLTPGTTREDVRRCIANWNKGDNGILDLSAAYRLKPGTGWMVGPRILHAPGSLCTYEPQWGSDVFGMYQNIVEGREVPWSLLVKDMPADKGDDIDFIVDQLDLEANLDPAFKANHFIEPIAIEGSDPAAGFVDRWIVYGRIDKAQPFTAKELTVQPQTTCTIVDQGAQGIIVVQGKGRINGNVFESPTLIRFTDMTLDEAFVTERAARQGVVYENTSKTEPMVVLRYFGPDANPDAPAIGDHRTQ